MVSRRLRVFICHSSDDKPAVRDLNERLKAVSWIETWLDEEKIEVGQDWEHEIEEALDASDAVIVSLSRGSVTKEGYVQRELRFVIDIATEKPEGTIFILPVRLEDCEPPRKLRNYHYADYFPVNQRGQAFVRIHRSLELRAKQLGILNSGQAPKQNKEQEMSLPRERKSLGDMVKGEYSKNSPIKYQKPVSTVIKDSGLAQSLGSSKQLIKKELSFLEKLDKFWDDNSWWISGIGGGFFSGWLLSTLLAMFIAKYLGYGSMTTEAEWTLVFTEAPWILYSILGLTLVATVTGYYIGDRYYRPHK